MLEARGQVHPRQQFQDARTSLMLDARQPLRRRRQSLPASWEQRDFSEDPSRSGKRGTITGQSPVKRSQAFRLPTLKDWVRSEMP